MCIRDSCWILRGVQSGRALGARRSLRAEANEDQLRHGLDAQYDHDVRGWETLAIAGSPS
eukprot:1158731-Alexandrium_andersonii.AAC.1